jgi:hypothetical protein
MRRTTVILGLVLACATVGIAAEEIAVRTASAPTVQEAVTSDAAVAPATPAQPAADTCSAAATKPGRIPGEGDNQPASGCPAAGSCGGGSSNCSATSCTGPHDTGESQCNGVTCFAPYTVHYYLCDCTYCQGGNCEVCPANQNLRFHCAL